MIGAGTYANNLTCGISCTGHGEMFIRAVAAHDVSCLMEYKGFSLQQAMEVVVHEKLMDIGGEGGMIGVDAQGNAALVFNSQGMSIGFNDNWGTDPNASVVTAKGLAPTDVLESALALMPTPGPYTVIVAGQSGGTGLGLVEIYHTP